VEAPSASLPSANPVVATSPTVSPPPGLHATPTPTPSSLASAAPVGAVGPEPTLRPIATYAGGWAPYAVANAFGFPVQSGFGGNGITVAVINDYPPSQSDVTAYLTQLGVQRTGTYTVENVDGGSSQKDASGFLESTIDVETVEGLAPAANVIYYSTPDLSTESLLDAYNQIISDGKAQVVDMSYGGCESSVGSGAADSLFAQGAAQGIAFVAASGDFGDECFSAFNNQIGVNFPASDPHVIGVGGTETATLACQLGTITSQSAWNDRCKTGNVQEATGGGTSTMFSLPAYQAAVGVSGAYRSVPDLAMPAALDALYLQGGWVLVSGTSWGAPQVAALVAGLYEFCRAPLANPIQLFYSAFGQKGYGDFVAVTSGNNQYQSDSTFFSADGGFSQVSGIGIPSGMAIAQTVCPNRGAVSLAPASRGTLATVSRGTAQAFRLPAAPNVRGLSDQGHRADDAPTRVALVLRSTSSVADDERTVIEDLRAAGFTIVQTFPNHLVIDAQAPASVVATYFQSAINDFGQGPYGTRYANVTPIIVPAAIAPYVQSALADNIVVAVPQSRLGGFSAWRRR
jgi:subtilase family serine protease